MHSNTAATLSPVNTLTEAEISQARLFLAEARDVFVGAVRGLSREQWEFKPAPDRWSIAEVTEHALFVQEYVLGPRGDQLTSAPPAPADHDPATIDAIVIHQFPSRLSRFSGPGFAAPAGGLELQDALRRIRANHDRALQCVESECGLREHALEAMPLKAVTNGRYTHMDSYQWILAEAAHVMRHVKQILEVKAHSNFPGM